MGAFLMEKRLKTITGCFFQLLLKFFNDTKLTVMVSKNKKLVKIASIIAKIDSFQSSICAHDSMYSIILLRAFCNFIGFSYLCGSF